MQAGEWQHSAVVAAVDRPGRGRTRVDRVAEAARHCIDIDMHPPIAPSTPDEALAQVLAMLLVAGYAELGRGICAWPGLTPCETIVVAGSLVAFRVDEGDRKRLARHFSHDPRRSLRDNVLWVKGSVGGEVVAVVGGNHPLAERVLHPSPPVAARPRPPLPHPIDLRHIGRLGAATGEAWVQALTGSSPEAGWHGPNCQPTGVSFGEFSAPLALSPALRSEVEALGGRVHEEGGGVVRIEFIDEWLLLACRR